MADIDRAEVSRALAKAIAFKACGKDRDAEAWARRLVELLQCADILVPAGSLGESWNRSRRPAGAP